MAEGLFRYHASQAGKSYLSVSSMGTHGMDKQPASDPAIKVCKKHNIDISGHLSRPLVEDEILKAKYVLCMEPMQEQFIKTFFPSHRDKIHLLGTMFADRKQRSPVIRDPMGSSMGMYTRVFKLIDLHVKRVLLFL